VDRADRVFLDVEVFDGHECVGFEISAAKYGDNPKERFDRIWFDVETKLPARIERHGIPLDFDPGRTLVIIHDQFEYHAEVPADLFLPAIPDGYVNAHPDEIREAINAETKGQMIYAEVPEGLRDSIVTALKGATAGSYRQGHEWFFFANDVWRTDRYSDDGDTLLAVNWYTPGDKFSDVPFESQNGGILTEVRAEQGQSALEATKHEGQSRPRHPMKHILFLAGLIDEADRFFEQALIDGAECYGFELSAKKYGDNPDDMIHRLWFDVATNLPVRMEFEFFSESSGQTGIVTKDQFDWAPDLPEDFFLPQVPPGFAELDD
jgi:outer membrane lipoprotein-sorting protein